MTSQIKGMAQGIRNANDGISLAQTAEGALNEVGNMLQRMRELKVQSSNGTYSTADKANITNEQTTLAAQISAVVKNTQFNNKALFSAASTVSIQTGATTNDTVSIGLRDLTATYVAATTGATPAPATGSQLGAIVDFAATSDSAALKRAVIRWPTTTPRSPTCRRSGLAWVRPRTASSRPSTARRRT